MPAGLERWSNLYHRVDQFKVGAGDVGSLQNRGLDRGRLDGRRLRLLRLRSGHTEENES